MLNIVSEKPIPSKSLTPYNGLAYDGCWFYLTVHGQCKIIKYDRDFHKKQYFETSRSYTYICYDTKDKCFWASSDSCPCMIYKLNECMEEIDAINLRVPNLCCGTITGISYYCCNDLLLVSLASYIIRVDKNCIRNSCILSNNNCGRALGIVSICPYYISYYASEKNKFLCIYNDSGTLIHEHCFNCDYIIESAVLFPCANDSTNLHVYVLITKKGCYPYILDCVLDCDLLCNICECNFELCNCVCPEDTCCCHKKSCCDVLESIAMVECSIAHILNAEGDKIHKVVASTDDISKILEANNSVYRIMDKAIFLEQLLCSKLEKLRDCWDFCKDDDFCDCLCQEIDKCHNDFTDQCKPVTAFNLDITDNSNATPFDKVESMEIIDSNDVDNVEAMNILDINNIENIETTDILDSNFAENSKTLDITDSYDVENVHTLAVTDSNDVENINTMAITDSNEDDKVEINKNDTKTQNKLLSKLKHIPHLFSQN